MLGKYRRLRFASGERASYSNLGYLVVGEVISEVSGMRYEEYVREEILAPLGMNRTGFSYPLIDGGEVATGYHPLRPALISVFRAALPRGAWLAAGRGGTWRSSRSTSKVPPMGV